MGVLGLYPFLQKAFPNVVKQLPHRLRDLAGQRIVIDGTLITQRLHFAPVPHAYRHVLGWYRLAKEFQDSGVSAVCVFDGNERSAAKARETERRRQVQKLAQARAAIELDRLQRLHRLAALVNDFQSKNITPAQSKQLSELFDRISSEHRPLFSQTDRVYQLQEEDLAHVIPYMEDASDFPNAPMLNVEGEEDYLDQLDALQEEDATPIIDYLPLSSNVYDPIILDDPAKATDFSRTLHGPPGDDLLPWKGPAEAPDILATDLPDALTSLYSQFRGSVSKLASLTPVPLRGSPSADDEARMEYSMSKTQLQLAADEAKFWADLASDSLTEPPAEALMVLTSRAGVISDSYRRRTNPPTTRTYDECKELLRAMGVACVDSTGTYEAEALAASMVHHGLADYVASEDTDVIVYEAPLIRNLTNRNGPLTVLSGTEIRAALQLDRLSFIDFALLLGTDFTQRIKNVGPTRALKFIREHKCIERVLICETKYVPRLPAETYLAEVETARMVFQTLPPVPDARLLEQEKDQEALSTVLQRCGLGRLLFNEDWNYEGRIGGHIGGQPLFR
ncbi:PIN domain-like protein [Mycena amicta]|nr:PIN domain-like protein [Mycena amicta]